MMVFLIHNFVVMMFSKRGRNMKLEMVISYVSNLYIVALVHWERNAIFDDIDARDLIPLHAIMAGYTLNGTGFKSMASTW